MIRKESEREEMAKGSRKGGKGKGREGGKSVSKQLIWGCAARPLSVRFSYFIFRCSSRLFQICFVSNNPFCQTVFIARQHTDTRY